MVGGKQQSDNPESQTSPRQGTTPGTGSVAASGEIQRARVVYFIKSPGRYRASFALIKRITQPDGSKSQPTVRSERIDALNRQLRNGFDRMIVEMEVRRVCEELNAEERKGSRGVWVASEGNQKHLKEYWEKEYSDRKIRRPETAMDRLRWAIDQLGPEPLLGDRLALQRVVDAKCRGNPRKQRRLCAVLNQMRKYFGVKDQLRLEKKTRPKFRYLTEDEFNRMLAHVEKPLVRDLFTVLMYAGPRIGEAFFLDWNHYHKGILRVLGQIDREGNEVGTKTGRIRSTILFDAGVEAFQRWASADYGEKKNINRTQLCKTTKSACKKAFPGRPEKWITAHDLRHSFAVMCLQKYEFSIARIAQLLGNSVTVCEEYYLPYAPAEDELQALAERARRIQSA